MTNEKELISKIEFCRQRMVVQADENESMTNDQVVEISQSLDHLINEFQKLKMK